MQFDPSWGRIFLDFIVYKYPTLLESFWDKSHGDINMSNDITSATLRLDNETVNRMGRTNNQHIKEATFKLENHLLETRLCFSSQRDGMSIAASSEMQFDPSWGRILS